MGAGTRVRDSLRPGLCPPTEPARPQLTLAKPKKTFTTSQSHIRPIAVVGTRSECRGDRSALRALVRVSSFGGPVRVA